MGGLECRNVEVGVVPHGIRSSAFGPLHCEAGSAAAPLVQAANRPSGGESDRRALAWQNEAFAQAAAQHLPVADRGRAGGLPVPDVDPPRSAEPDLVAGRAVKDS